MVLKLALAAVVVGSMARAFIGPPAPPSHGRWARLLLLLTGACYGAGAALTAFGGAELAGALLVLAGIESSCVAAWIVRAAPEEGGGGGGPGDEGGGGGGGPRRPGPVDWDAFDRARRAWDRTPAAR